MKALLKKIFKRIYLKVEETKDYQAPIKFGMYIIQKFTRNRRVPWPVHHTSIVTGHQNIEIGIDTNPGYMPGCYIQGIGNIKIGDYTQISSNVGIISSNHNVYDTREHILSSVVIERYCWIGMNAVVMPGVVLGEHTIVGAGAVVTKSFEEGYCIIAGNPAKKIRDINPNKVIKFKNKFLYIGYNKIS